MRRRETIPRQGREEAPPENQPYCRFCIRHYDGTCPEITAREETEIKTDEHGVICFCSGRFILAVPLALLLGVMYHLYRAAPHLTQRPGHWAAFAAYCIAFVLFCIFYDKFTKHKQKRPPALAQHETGGKGVDGEATNKQSIAQPKED